MRFHIVLLYLAKFSFAFSQESVEIAVSYFQERNVKTVCLLSGSNHIGIRFAKEANKHSITVLQYINNDTTKSSCQRQVYTHTGIVLNTDDPPFQDVLFNASENNIFDSNRIWLIFDENNSTEINTIYSILNLSVNVDVTIAQRMASTIVYVTDGLEIIKEKVQIGKYFYRIPTTGVGKFENQFLTPFTRDVWFSVIGVITLCGLGLLLSAKLENRPKSGHYAFFSVVALSCQQFFEDIDDSVVKKDSTARKLTILVTGISCVLIFNYYTSSVVSWLLNGPPPSINSLWELMDSPLEPIFEDVGYTWSWLQLPDYYYNKKNARAEDVLKKRIKKKGNLILTTPTKGVEMIRTGAYAFHCDANSANKYIAKTFTPKELCDLDSLPSFEKALLYTSVQKNSPYREFFIWSYARITEQGIMKLIQSRTYPRVMKCEGSSPRALALGGAAPAFIMLATGYVAGTFIMFIERYNQVSVFKIAALVNYDEFIELNIKMQASTEIFDFMETVRV
ncbi:unnamed protein product [Pieris brassicae]|uniref:Ionotropic receptor 75a N-terminal domain-containing protein n=1 Tax=Pieris brassicae TaxID=7116 RepID=A0A9P0X554_PIEBR|nr:unnamed protein product [Pieris brassicae]